MRNNFSNLAANLNLKDYGGFVLPLNVVETDHLASKSAEVFSGSWAGSGQVLYKRDGAEPKSKTISNHQLVFIPAPSHGKLSVEPERMSLLLQGEMSFSVGRLGSVWHPEGGQRRAAASRVTPAGALPGMSHWLETPGQDPQ